MQHWCATGSSFDSHRDHWHLRNTVAVLNQYGNCLQWFSMVTSISISQLAFTSSSLNNIYKYRVVKPILLSENVEGENLNLCVGTKQLIYVYTVYLLLQQQQECIAWFECIFIWLLPVQDDRRRILFCVLIQLFSYSCIHFLLPNSSISCIIVT